MGEAHRYDMVVSLLEFIPVDMLDVRIGNLYDEDDLSC